MWIGFCVSFLLCLGCIVLAKFFGIGVDFIVAKKPQKFHQQNISRLGGVGIFVGFIVLFLLNFPFNLSNILIFLGLSVVFLAGVLEDVLEILSPRVRLFIQLLGIIILLSSGAGLITNLLPLAMLPWYWGVAFSLFGILGVCNAINIIDGLNGLASGIALIVFAAIIFVAFGREIDFVYRIAQMAIVVILGFYVLNFPFGKIFLGDGGAYFLGTLIAFLLGVLSDRGVSAWFGLSVMIYPVWEVIFSILRRKIKGQKAMHPDGLHLHSLLFKINRNNSFSALLLVCLYACYVFLVLVCVDNTIGFMWASFCFCILYMVFYIYLYKKYKKIEAGKVGI
ncbi:glycosyltransferase family 4 protein [Helicobacter anatolicus]|uniref:glycosyltransferase family 4 protein n=1 Tax=Helicobacter anatolicus TaxID=2905874 RepID=UPI001E496FFD|nr:MraY family glycosyltransferase [Helicobacter anatolicus]MCE3039698.1 undecaprenyl/decaprenyl-phosphate alpha-N-acetylglucosaminyl 1-phosphate transferase [Helicobacter anatolicus]